MSEVTPLLSDKVDELRGLSRCISCALQTPLLTFGIAMFTRAKVDQYGRRIPQAIAHRGYKAAFPENTMSAFKGAVAIGAQALETDVHLSKDGVVVLSHVRKA